MTTHEKLEQARLDHNFYVKKYHREMNSKQPDIVKLSALNLMEYLTFSEMNKLSAQERQERCEFCHGDNNRINQLEGVGSIPMIYCPVCGRKIDDD
jgi:hypothetical protein